MFEKYVCPNCGNILEVFPGDIVHCENCDCWGTTDDLIEYDQGGIFFLYDGTMLEL